MEEFDLLREQFQDNAIKWYPFEENINYIILKNFSKEDENKLQEVCKSITQNNRIILLLKNKLALKNMCQDDEEYSNIESLYNKKEIEELLDMNGLKYRKFYYLLPDLNTTNVIFTDEYMPNKELISRDIALYNNTIIKNDEKKKFIDLIEQDESLFQIFANSFFIECGKESFIDNEIKFVSFSNMRKEKYRIQTTIKNGFVYKKAFDQKSKEHIEGIKKNIDILNQLSINTLDSYDGAVIISKYQNTEETLDAIINKKIKLEQYEEVIEIIRKFYEFLKEKLIITGIENNIFDKLNIKYEKEKIKKLTFVKYGFWDMIFQNVFYINNDFYFFDQEWFEKIIPLEFIIYRACVYCKGIKDILNEKNILDNFEITKENIELFKKLDEKIQLNIRNEIFWKYHIKSITVQKFKENKEKSERESLKLLNSKDARICLLEKNMEDTVKLLQEKDNTLNAMRNSISWKITKPLRKIRKDIKKENENKG